MSAETSGTEPEEGPRRGVAGSSAVMFSGTLVSRLLGMVKAPLLLGAAIGINYGAANAFAVSNKLPNLIYMLIAGGVLNAILVPQIVRAIRNHDDDGRAYVNRLLTVGMAGLAVVTAVLTLASPMLVSLYAANLSPEWYDVAVTFGYWCIPQLFFYGTYTLFGQVLNARNVFGPYMWAPALNNLVAIAGLVAYLLVFGGTSALDPADAGVWGVGRTALLAGTATLGILAQAVVLLVPLHRSGFRYRPQWGLRGSGLGRASRMAMWVFAALAANQAAYVVVSNVAAYAAGSAGDDATVAGNAAYDTAFVLYTLPTSLVTVSLVTALFTRMSANAAAKDLAAVRVDVSKGLRTVSVFTVFAAGTLMVLAQPVVRVVAATVSYPEVRSIAHVVVAMLPGLVAVGIFTMCQRVFYAFEDARGLFRLQIPMVLLLAGGAAASALLPAQWTVVGIGVAMSVSSWVGAIVTYLGLRQHLRTVDGARVLRTHLRLVLAVLPSTLLGWGLLRLVGTGADMSVLGALWRVLVVGSVSAVVYLLALRALGVEELRTLGDPVGRLLVAMGGRIPDPVGGALVRLGLVLAPDAARTAAAGDGGPDDGGVPAGDPGAGAPGPGGGRPGPGGGAPASGMPTDEGAGGAAVAGAVAAATTPGTSPSTRPGSPAALRRLDDARGKDEMTGGTALNQRTDSPRRDAQQLLGERYELGEPLETTVGGVERRRARDLTLEADVEVLLLPSAGSKVAEVLDAARRASLVDDHRLLRVLDVGTDDDSAFVVTDQVTGPDLSELTASGGLPPEQARAVIGEAAGALEAARRHGVRHLALRPACLHVTPDGEVLVTGLGTDAVLLESAEEPDASPLDTARRDATDLVHLLYLALTGAMPEEGAPSPRQARPEVPGDLDELCARTLVGDGPHSSGELLRLLAPWPAVDTAALPVLVPPPPPPPEHAAADSPDGATDGTAGGVAGTAEGAADTEGEPAGVIGAGAAQLTRPTRRPVWAPVLPVDASGAVLPPPPPPDEDASVMDEEPDQVETPEPEAASDEPQPAAEGQPAEDQAPVQEASASEDAEPPEDVEQPAEAEQQEESPESMEREAVSDAPTEIPVVPPRTLSWTPPPPPAAPSPQFPEILQTLDAPTEIPVVPPRTLSWTPPPPPAAPSPQFPEILQTLDAPADDAGTSDTARHSRTAARFAVAGTVAAGLARSAGSAVTSGARRATEGTRNAASAGRASVGSAVAARRQRATEAAEQRGEDTAATGQGDGGGDVPPEEDLLSAVDGSEVPFKERRIDPTPVVLVVVLALVLVLLLVSLRVLLAPPEPVNLPDDEPAPTAEETTPEETTTEPTEEPTEQEVQAPPPVIASLAPLDPEGDGLENPELTPRALDQDPATFWRSRSYVDPEYGMKSGIGLVITLEENSTVSRVEMDLMGNGGMVEIRATSPDNPTQGDVLASGEMGPDSIFEFDPVETETIVLWFPRLPVADSDGLNRIELAELRVG